MMKDGISAIFNTYVYYTSVATPTLMYQRHAVKCKPFANKEYVVKMLITEQDYKALKKRYKGTVKSVKEIKEYDAQEFEAAFKVEPPYEAESYFIWKITQKAFYESDGNRNKARIKLGTKGAIDIGNGMIGNGSKADVQWRDRKFTHKEGSGLVLDLIAVRITELVPYGEDALAFEMDEVELEPNFGAEEETAEGNGGGSDQEYEGDHNDYCPDDEPSDGDSSTGKDSDIPF